MESSGLFWISSLHFFLPSIFSLTLKCVSQLERNKQLTTLFRCNKLRWVLLSHKLAELTLTFLACSVCTLAWSRLQFSDTRDIGMDRILLISLSLKRTKDDEPPDVADILCKDTNTWRQSISLIFLFCFSSNNRGAENLGNYDWWVVRFDFKYLIIRC